ncbi:hypothetical protein DSECCO2_612850 [anaerobic digester metagenome]
MIFVALILNYVSIFVITQFNSLDFERLFLLLTLVNWTLLLGYGSWLHLQNKYSIKCNEDSIDSTVRYYVPYFFVIFIICMAFIFTMILILTTQLDAAIAFFSYFEISQQLLTTLTSQIPTFIGLPGFFAYLIGFFALFSFIRRRGVMIYDAEGNIKATYIDSMLSFFGFFNYLILIPLVMYLLGVKHQLFESIVLVGLLLLTKMVFIPLFSRAAKLLQDYKALSICNPYYSNEDIKEGSFHNKMILLKMIFGHTISKKDDILKGMMSLTLLIPLLGVGLNFNALSVVYTGLTFITWYFILSAVMLLPFKKVNIHLKGGQILQSVYIIEDSRKGHLIVLTPEEQKSIMKESISKTEISKY